MKTKRNKWVWGELNADRTHVVRIFKSKKAAVAAGLCAPVVQVLYAYAVHQIRHQLFVRSHGECEICLAPVTEDSGHMHEKRHRGKGGEISLDNSIFICLSCHRRAHQDRNPRFKKKFLTF